MKRIIFLFVMAVIHSYGYSQQTLDLRTLKLTRCSGESFPFRSIDYLEDGITVKYDLENVVLMNDPLYDSAKSISIKGFWENHKTGQPAYLMRWDTFVVPDEKVKVSLVDTAFVEYDMEISPARPVLWENDNDYYSKENVLQISGQRGFFPSSPIPAVNKERYRENNLFEVCVSPVLYDHNKKKIRIYKRLAYKVVFDNKEFKSEVKAACGKSVPINSFLRNITLNAWQLTPSGKAMTPSWTSTQLEHSRYLILSNTKYKKAVERFAEWKRTLGYDIRVSMSSHWTQQEVLDTARNICSNEDIDYLLIIGSYNDVPGQATNLRNNHGTDLYYGCTDTESYIPSVYRGRLPVRNLSEANIVVDKIINYEKNPCQDTAMYGKGLHIAYFQDENNDGVEDRRFVLTSERIRNFLMQKGKAVSRVYYADSNVHPTRWNDSLYSYGGLLPAELRDASFNWNGSADNIQNLIEQKCFYVFYRGHGQIIQWSNPAFENENAEELTNGNALPVVFSITCNTGNYQFDRFFSEDFLKNQNGGCSAIIAATSTSLSGENDVLSEGIFDAIWPDTVLWPRMPIIPDSNNISSMAPTPTYQLGQILDQGLWRVYEAFHGTDRENNDNYLKYTYEVFHCFGDPSMMLLTEAPTEFSNASIIRANGIINVDTGGEMAKITFYNRRTLLIESFFGTACAYADDPEISVCISAHNKIPFIDGGTIYIQNKTLGANDFYEAKTIKVGHHVTNTQTEGDVNFSQNRHILVGDQIELHPGTTVCVGSTLEIRNK